MLSDCANRMFRAARPIRIIKRRPASYEHGGPPPSCQIDYLLRSKLPQSINRFRFFTDDINRVSHCWKGGRTRRCRRGGSEEHIAPTDPRELAVGGPYEFEMELLVERVPTSGKPQCINGPSGRHANDWFEGSLRRTSGTVSPSSVVGGFCRGI
jgi:hypothetical protein